MTEDKDDDEHGEREPHKSVPTRRTAIDAVVLGLTPVLGVLALLQGGIKPLFGDGVASLVVAVSALAVLVGVVILVRRARGRYKNKRSARVLSLGLVLLLAIGFVALGFALAELVRPNSDSVQPSYATFREIYDSPRNCSRSYEIDGSIGSDPRAKGMAVWVFSELFPDPSAQRDQPLYYAKQQVPSDPFRMTLMANTETGTRSGRNLLVAVDKTTDHKLHGRDESDQLLRLPPGSTVLAVGKIGVQRC